MGKYLVGDVIKTRYGKGTIIEVWRVNKQITVFKTFMAGELKIRNIFYGEIEEILYRG